MSYKPSYINRQRIFNAFMLYSTIRIIQSIFFREVHKKTCGELGFGNDLTKSKYRERLDQQFGQDKISPCYNVNSRVKGFSEGGTNLNFRFFFTFLRKDIQFELEIRFSNDDPVKMQKTHLRKKFLGSSFFPSVFITQGRSVLGSYIEDNKIKCW